MPRLLLIVVALFFLSSCKPAPTALLTVKITDPTWRELELDPTFTDANYTRTQYPFVLVHGLYGFKDIFGLNYFHLVAEALEIGGAKVYTVSVSGLESSENRGEQLLAQVEDIVAIEMAQNPLINKVNLVGHSHGGPTTRYVASVRPDLVASVSTVHGANAGGSATADAVDEAINKAGTWLVLQATFNALGVLIDTVANDPHHQNAHNSFQSLSFEGIDGFNTHHPQAVPLIECDEGAYEVNGVKYYSWGGNLIRTNKYDPLDWLMAASGDVVGPNSDGMVPQCSQNLGMVIRNDYGHNHLDAMNWTVGLRMAGTTNPLTIYRSQANRLKNAGL
jgi:triacylglycerol lipase